MSNRPNQTSVNQVRANLKAADAAGGKAARRPPRPTTANQNPAGLVISLALHAGLVIATVIVWQHAADFSQVTHSVPVELVIQNQTNVRAEAPPPEPDKPIKDIMPEPTMPNIVPPEVGPLPPVPKIKIATPKDTDQKPTDTPKSRKQTAKDMDQLLNNILAQAKTPKNAKRSDKIVEGAGNQALASADLVSALQSQVERCWSPPIGAPNADDLVVDFNLKLNADGTVLGQPQLAGRLAGHSLNDIPNGYTSAAAQAAFRAIYQCAPYKLPPKRYDEWKEINPFRFDPRQMMGQ